MSIYIAFALKVMLKPGNYLAFKPEVKFGDVKNDKNAKYDGIIRLKTPDGNGFCSGFVVDGSYAMTAAHCVDWLSKGQDIHIYDKKNTNTGTVAHVLGYNQRNDSAVIYGDFKNFKAVRIEKDTHGFIASKGPFLTCGYPYDQKNLYCSYANPISTENFAMKLTGALIPGMSGGPVFDAVTNKVVGLNSAVSGEFIIVYPIVGVLGSFDLDN